MARTRRELTLHATAQVGSPLAWPHLPEGPATLDGIPPPTPGRVLIGGVGYSNLRDRSFGPLLVERLRDRAWPSDVVVDDLSFGPIDVLFKLQAEPRPFRLGIFVGAVARGRSPGIVEQYTWSAPTLPPEPLQERIAEAVTGVVCLENLLCILAHFGALPARSEVIEVEPEAEEGWGPDLSPQVSAAFDTVETRILETLAASNKKSLR